MNKKDKIKLYIKIFRTGLFVLLVSVIGCLIAPFFAHAIENDWGVENTVYTSPLDYNIYYDLNGLLTFEADFTQTYTYSFGFTPVYSYYRYANTTGSYQFPQFSLKLSGVDRYVLGVLCDSEYIVSNTLRFGWSSHDWCRVPIGEKVKLHVQAIRNQNDWGSEVYNETGLTKTDIDNFYGTDYLETNATFSYIQTLVSDFDIATNKAFIAYYDYPNYHSFPFGSDSFNGACGSADNGSFAVAPETDLCLTGTASEVLSDGSTFFWSCEGSEGMTDDYCFAYHDLTADNPLPAVCGSATAFSHASAPTEDLCSVGYEFPAFHDDVNNLWTWRCYNTLPDLNNLSENYIPCSSLVSALSDGQCGSAHETESAVIPSNYGTNLCLTGSSSLVIWNDSTKTWDWSCVGLNGGTTANCYTIKDNSSGWVLLISSWFSPSKTTLSRINSFSSLTRDKVPFGYFFDGKELLYEFFDELTNGVAQDYVISLPSPALDNSMIEVWSLNDFKTELGTGWTIYWNLMIAVQWIMFFTWIYRKIRIFIGDYPDDLENAGTDKTPSDPFWNYPLYK